MPNHNSLHSISCPWCGHTDSFAITATSIFEISDEGVEDHQDVIWDALSPCSCPACHAGGLVCDFTEPARDDAGQFSFLVTTAPEASAGTHHVQADDHAHAHAQMLDLLPGSEVVRCLRVFPQLAAIGWQPGDRVLWLDPDHFEACAFHTVEVVSRSSHDPNTATIFTQEGLECLSSELRLVRRATA